MKNNVLKLIIGILAMLHGSVSTIVRIIFFTNTFRDLGGLVSVAIFVMGLILLLTKDRGTARAMVIGILVGYFAIFGVGIITFISVSRTFRTGLGLNVLPVIFSIIYLVNDQKETNPAVYNSTNADSIHHKMTGRPTSTEERLNAVTKLYDDGLISYDEYVAKRKKIIENL